MLQYTIISTMVLYYSEVDELSILTACVTVADLGGGGGVGGMLLQPCPLAPR